jgi:hypothetical protein
MKNLELVTFRFVAQCVDQPRHRVLKRGKKNDVEEKYKTRKMTMTATVVVVRKEEECGREGQE